MAKPREQGRGCYMYNDKQMVRFFTFEQYHAKSGVGSTRLRVHNLIKNWQGSGLYKYGEFPDVLIYQKVYATLEYKFPLHFPNIQILDICDPDWTQSPDIFIKETIDAMDAVVVTTEQLREYLQQMTTTPVRVIKDRFDLSEFPKPKVHRGKIKKVVWFGYAHNAESIRFAVPSLEKRDLDLMIVANEDPACWRWANSSRDYEKHYEYVKYRQENVYEVLQEADVCIMMPGIRPLDIFKSENKTVTAQLLGLPVVTNADQLDQLNDPEARNKYIETIYDKLKQEYDVNKSVAEYKELIDEIRRNRTN